MAKVDLLIHFGAWEFITEQFSDSDLAETRDLFEREFAQLEDSLRDLDRDGRPPPGAELDVNIETVARELGRLHTTIPPDSLGLGPREMKNLEQALGITLGGRGEQGEVDQYSQTIFPALLGLVTSPQDFRGGHTRKDSRIWEWAEAG